MAGCGVQKSAAAVVAEAAGAVVADRGVVVGQRKADQAVTALRELGREIWAGWCRLT